MTAFHGTFPASPRHAGVRSGVPGPPSEVPPRRPVPRFPPVRAGCGGLYRLGRAVRRSPAPLAAGLLATAAALASGAPCGAAAPGGGTPCAPAPGSVHDGGRR
ncbi:hypothetical protein [Streptomyces sp. NPDC001380]|uniref:hypothetical protein n=1 Tax=Streptomyces sp. NPDC001380 TaxID=3364566 RepID=UPI003690AE5A